MDTQHTRVCVSLQVAHVHKAIECAETITQLSGTAHSLHSGPFSAGDGSQVAAALAGEVNPSAVALQGGIWRCGISPSLLDLELLFVSWQL